jgi:vesicle coat complex subunit
MSDFNLANLLDFGKMLGVTADAIAKLGDSIAHLVKLGVRGWDDVAARRTRAKLIAISAQLSVMGGRGNASVVESLRTYIAAHEGRDHLEDFTKEQLWDKLLSRIRAALPEVKSLFAELAENRSDLVTQDIYHDLISALNDRAMILEKLSTSSPPTSAAEIDALRDAAERYDALRHNLHSTINGLHWYIRDGFGRLPFHDADVRRSAADALSNIGPAAADAVPALAEALKDQDTGVRRSAADALSNIGPAAADAVPALAEALKDQDTGVRRSAAYALSNIGPAAAEAVQVLADALKNQNRDVRRIAAKAFQRIGPAATNAVPALVNALKDQDTVVRLVAADALGKIGPTAVHAAAALAEALQDQDSDVRLRAAGALKSIHQK